jgi:tellurite resistance protein
MDPAAFYPLFSNVSLSADEATAIAAALRDVAAVDGSHADEQQMLDGLMAEIGDEFGETLKPAEMTPAELATKVVDPALRRLTLQSAVLLAMADGAISKAERERIVEYARALGVSSEDYQQIESTIEGWVRSGDASPLFS